MNIEALLSADFKALVKRLDADGFARRVLKRIEKTEQRRLIVIGAAGTLGAAIAATQFQSLIRAIADAFPMLANVAVAEGAATLDFSAAPMVMAALLFALVGGVTAMIAPGSR